MKHSACQHGVLIRVAQCGVLINGAAGSGKSQLGLELIARGHQLVADDIVDIERQQTQLLGRGVNESSEFLALRCGAVVPIARRFGKDALCAVSSIDLVVSPGPALTPLAAIPEIELLGLRRPLHYLQNLAGSAVCVEALAHNWCDQQQGYDAADDLQQRLQARMSTPA
ncbi:MAG: hypothetical protein ACSHXK_02960 [Oceanococcus sp.]